MQAGLYKIIFAQLGTWFFQRRPNGHSWMSSGWRTSQECLTQFFYTLIVGLVNYSHRPELLMTVQVQVSPLKWLLTSGQDSREKICGIAIRRLGELEGAVGTLSLF